MYQENIFNNTLDSFKQTKEYGYVKAYREQVKIRIKIYLRNYYGNTNFEKNPYDILVEMFEVLNLINYDMCDKELETFEKNYFLEDCVNEICKMYNIDDYTLHLADEEAKNYNSFKYLETQQNSKIK